MSSVFASDMLILLLFSQWHFSGQQVTLKTCACAFKDLLYIAAPCFARWVQSILLFLMRWHFVLMFCLYGNCFVSILLGQGQSWLGSIVAIVGAGPHHRSYEHSWSMVVASGCFEPQHCGDCCHVLHFEFIHHSVLCCKIMIFCDSNVVARTTMGGWKPKRNVVLHRQAHF